MVILWIFQNFVRNLYCRRNTRRKRNEPNSFERIFQFPKLTCNVDFSFTGYFVSPCNWKLILEGSQKRTFQQKAHIEIRVPKQFWQFLTWGEIVLLFFDNLTQVKELEKIRISLLVGTESSFMWLSWQNGMFYKKVSMVFLSGKFMDISTFSSGIYIAEVMLGRQENEPNS